MKVLINALSVTNASGRHVVRGHLSRFVKWTADRHDYVVLVHRENQDVWHDLGPNVRTVECPPVTASWRGRAWWERTRMPGLVRLHAIDAVYSPSGGVTSRLQVPQVSYAQNPWALVPGLPRSLPDAFKGFLQRAAYRQAMRSAAVMVFISRYLQEAYRGNAGGVARREEVIYPGVDEETFKAAQDSRGKARDPLRVVSVSAMAPHKGAETLVSAIALVRQRHGIAATLSLIGAWPDPAYRSRIETLVGELGLTDAVSFEGHVGRDELHDAYARARVFALMSRCESFGIPAVEAQAFGTPVVSSNCCAIPEVCGDGGLYPDPGRVDDVAIALRETLTDDSTWQRLSAAALENVERFRWDRCSAPYVKILDDLAEQSTTRRAG